MSGLRAAIGFLTVLGGAAVPDRRTAGWFPVVGGLVGGALALVWWGADTLWPPLVAAGIVVAADLALTGLLHADGLADTADGLLAPMDRDRRLAVMGSPEVGAFALAVVPTVLLLRVAAIGGAMATDVWPGVCIGVWALSRTLMVVSMAAVPYARGRGLASAVATGARVGHGLWFVPAGALVTFVAGVPGAGAVLAAAAGGAAVVLLARRRLGGYTGDILGAAGIVAETGALLALAAT